MVVLRDCVAVRLRSWRSELILHKLCKEKELLNKGMEYLDSDENVCRICYEGDKLDDNFIIPCECRGSAILIHEKCLVKWMDNASNPEAREKCMVCNARYNVAPPERHLLSNYCRSIQFSCIFVSLTNVIISIMSGVAISIFCGFTDLTLDQRLTISFYGGACVYAIIVLYTWTYWCYVVLTYSRLRALQIMPVAICKALSFIVIPTVLIIPIFPWSVHEPYVFEIMYGIILTSTITTSLYLDLHKVIINLTPRVLPHPSSLEPINLDTKYSNCDNENKV